MSPRRELFNPEAPGARDLASRTNNPLLLLGMSEFRWALPFAARVGLELDAYRIGDESTTTSQSW